jgi:hypothetical protein
MTDHEYLLDLAERLRAIPVAYGTDEGDSDRLEDIAARLADLRSRVDVKVSEIPPSVTVEVLRVLVQRAGLQRIRETMTWEMGHEGYRVKLNYGLDHAINQLARATGRAPMDVLDSAIETSEMVAELFGRGSDQ